MEPDAENPQEYDAIAQSFGYCQAYLDAKRNGLTHSQAVVEADRFWPAIHDEDRRKAIRVARTYV